MTTPLNIISLSGAGNASASGAPASAADAGDAESGAFQSLLAVLLNLLGSSQGGETALSDGAQAALAAANANGAITNTTEAGRNGSGAFELGGLIDLSALLDLKAQLSADAANAEGDGTPDPLAAVLDLFIGALQTATNATPDGTGLTLDGKSADALNALNTLLASLTETGQGKTPQLPPETIDKLTKLDQLLAGQGDSAELAELKTRIADLLGSSSSRDAKTASAADPDQPNVAALLGQDAKQSTNQRDAMAQVLDGARTGLKSSTETGTGGTGDGAGQNQQQTSSGAQAQNARADHAARQAVAGAGDFAAQVSASAADAAKTGDATQDTIVTLAGQGAERAQASARALFTAYNQSANRVDMPQIAFEIARHAANGISRFEIRLDPPEMGRVDVRLDVDKSGAITARLTVERAETLDLLQRDARALERALSQNGLDNSKTNLEFSLRQNPFARQESGQDQNHQNMAALHGDVDAAASETETTVPPAVTLYRGYARPGGINLVA